MHIIKLYRITFIFHLLSLNHKILYNLFYVYFADHCGMDECLAVTFHTLSDTTRIVYEQFSTIAQTDLNVYHSRVSSFLFVLYTAFEGRLPLGAWLVKWI